MLPLTTFRQSNPQKVRVSQEIHYFCFCDITYNFQSSIRELSEVICYFRMLLPFQETFRIAQLSASLVPSDRITTQLSLLFECTVFYAASTFFSFSLDPTPTLLLIYLSQKSIPIEQIKERSIYCLIFKQIPHEALSEKYIW